MTTAFSPNSNELPLATYTVESRYLEPSLTRTKIDFPLITAILPWVTRTLDNSKVFFCFPSNHFYVIWPRSMFYARDTSKKIERNSLLQPETLNLIKIKTSVCSFVFTFLSVQFKCSVQPCIFIKICRLWFRLILFSKYHYISFCPWSQVYMVLILIAFLHHRYFLIFGYLLRTPDNSNFFLFPQKVPVIGSRL